MRHQTAAAGEATVGSGRTFRIDPTVLPVRYSAGIGSGAKRVEALIVLDRTEAVVRRPSPAGTPLTFHVPIGTFEGVAVRIVPVGQDGDIEVTVELMHRDPALSLPLIVAEDPADVAADWQAWGRALGLPLLLIRQDGSVEQPVDTIGAVLHQPTKPRRRHSFFANRRPRFLTRRKTGQAGEKDVLAGREIIARD